MVGYFWPGTAEYLKPLGDGFIKLVKMIIAPVIFLTVVLGIAGMSEIREAGRVALKAFAYFLFFSTLALIVGLIVANVVRPGDGMNVDPATLNAGAVATYTEQASHASATAFLLDIIPTTMVSALTGGSILQALFVAILFGISISLVGPGARPVVAVLESASEVFFRLVNLLMRAAPIGALGAFAFTIGKYGVGVIASLAALVATFYLTSALFVLVVLGPMLTLPRGGTGAGLPGGGGHAGGATLGRVGTTWRPHLLFEIRPAGRGAPRIDPKPILDGWKLLESTAIYRAAGRNPFFGSDADAPSIGQILLMSKEALAERVLGAACVVPAAGRRSMFVLPWGPTVVIGTTDTEYTGPLDAPAVDLAGARDGGRGVRALPGEGQGEAAEHEARPGQHVVGRAQGHGLLHRGGAGRLPRAGARSRRTLPLPDRDETGRRPGRSEGRRRDRFVRTRALLLDVPAEVRAGVDQDGEAAGAEPAMGGGPVRYQVEDRKGLGRIGVPRMCGGL